MDADLIHQIWLRADSVRGRQPLNLTNLVDIASEFTTVDWRLVSDLSTLLDRRLTDTARPRVMLEFINELSKRLQPKCVLDPFVVDPAVLVSAIDTPFHPDGTGIVRSERATKLGERLAPDVHWRFDNPFSASLAQGSTQYDLIVSSPLWDERAIPPSLHKDEPPSLSGNIDDLILFRVLRQLKPTGTAIFQVTESYFSDKKRLETRQILESLGYHLSGVFSINDARNITSSVIILTQQPVKNLFVGRLKEIASVPSLIENFLNRNPGDVFELGQLVPVDTYRGWAQHALLSTWDGNATPIRLGDIATLKIRRIAAGQTLASENTIYIPTLGTGPVTAVSPNYTGSGRYQVLEAILDPHRARADYVAEWFSSATGVATRRAFMVGATIPHMTIANAKNVPIDLPDIDSQDHVIQAAQQLHAMQTKVLQLGESLWKNPLDVWRIIIPELSRAVNSDPLRTSIDGLPYPLASILHQYVAKSMIDHKVSRLLQYFEATSAFSAILLLSMFHRDTRLFNDAREALTQNNSGRHRPPLFDRVDFGQWITLGFTLAKLARRTMNDKTLVSAWSQAIGPASAVATLLSTAEYWKLLDQARPIRNERAHGGIESERQFKTWLRGLEGALYELLRVTGSAWEEIRLFLPDSTRLRSGVWTYPQAKLLVGANDIFKEDEFTTLEPLETGQLVFASRNLGHEILPIVPLMQLNTSNTQGRFACYFFSAREGTDKFKYVSYHYEGEPQRTFMDTRVASLIKQLT